MRNTLPESIDPGQLATDGELFSGIWLASRCERVAAAVHTIVCDVELELLVTQARRGLFNMHGHIKVQLEVQCQRCLQPMPWLLEEPIQVCAATARLAEKLLKQESVEVDILELDDEGRINLGQWLEDEILLKLPMALSHKELSKCDSNMITRTTEYIYTEDSQPNPFAVLKKFKD